MNRSLKTTPLADRTKESLWKRIGGGALGCAILLHLAVGGLVICWRQADEEEKWTSCCFEREYTKSNQENVRLANLRKKLSMRPAAASSRITGCGPSRLSPCLPSIPLSPSFRANATAILSPLPLEQADAILKDCGD